MSPGRLDADDAILGEAVGDVAEQPDRLEHAVSEQRLEHVELEMALATGEVIVAWLPMTCAATMVTASHWVGLTLPGMIEEPGSFSGRAIRRSLSAGLSPAA